MFCIGITDTFIQFWILKVCIIIIGTGLPRTVGWIAHNHFDFEALLPFASAAVGFEHIADQIVFFIELECIGQANAIKRLIFTFLRTHEVVVHRFDVYRGNVVRQQYDFIGVDFVLVFIGKLFRAD